MRRFLSTKNLLAVLLCAAPLARAQLSATPIREAGAPLDPSIRNEADHAADLAAAWLAAKQGADGSWDGGTARVWRTSVSLVALVARGRAYADAAARAAVWLDGHAPVPRVDPPDAYAWRMIALLSVAPSNDGQERLAARLFHEANAFAPSPDAPLASRLLWNNAFRLASQKASSPPTPEDASALEALAARWSPADAPPHVLWHFARLVNTLGKGALETGGVPLDWRRDIAQTLINTQRRDPTQGAYWSAPGDTDAVIETAFGILVFSEL